MASSVATQKLRSGMLFQVWDHDSGTTDATVVTNGTTSRWVDMRDIEHFGVIAIQTVIGSSSGITKLEIVCADDTSGTNTVVIKDSGTVDADALCDWLMEECSVQEAAQLSSEGGYASRYIAGRITQSNAGDEAIAVYVGVPNRSYLNLTPATTIS